MSCRGGSIALQALILPDWEVVLQSLRQQSDSGYHMQSSDDIELPQIHAGPALMGPTTSEA